MAQKAELKTKINLDSTGFQRGIAKSKNSVKSFGRFLKGTFAPIIATVFGARAIKGIVDLGTSAEETASKFNAVFGPAAERVNDEITRMMETIPATRAELQDFTATVTTMGKAMGIPPEAASTLSLELAKLGSDVASFNNMKPEEVFLKMTAAITGEFEPLKRLGIVINQARLDAEALEMGIEKQGSTFTAAQKAILVYNILLKDTVDMQGDAAATVDSAANRLKFLKRDFIELATTIGENVVPQVQAFMDGLTIIGDWYDDFKSKFADENDPIVNAGINFTEMARQNLEARNELEETGKVISHMGVAKFAKDLAAVARNEAKIAQRAKELLAKYEALNQAEKDRISLQNESNESEAANQHLRDEAVEQYQEIKNEVIDILNELDALDGKEVEAHYKLTKEEQEADKNKSGYVTPREKRAQEREDRRKEKERRRKEREERAQESTVEASEAREEERKKKQKEQEMAGEKGKEASGEKAAEAKENKDLNESAKQTAENTKELLSVVKENP